MLGEIVDGLLMGIMGNDQPGVYLGICGIQESVKNVLGELNQVRTVVLPIVGVEIIQDDVISEIPKVLSTA